MSALVVGLGSIGCRHLRNLYTLGVRDLSAFRSRNLPLSGDIPPDVKIFKDYQTALLKKPEVVVIANPSALHLPYAKQAVEAGCSVYLEKPISNSLEGVSVLEALAASQNVKVLVGCQFRFHTHLEKIKEWMEEKKWGHIFSVVVDTGEYLPDWHPWEDYRESYAARKKLGGGVLLTQIHDLDYLYWLFGPIEKVFAMGGQLTPLQLDVEDTALVSLLTQNQTPIQLRTDYWRKPPVKRLHAVCEKGEIFWDYHARSLKVLHDGKILEHFLLDESWERNQMFLASLKNFLNSVENKETPRVPLSEGIYVLKLALAIKESMLYKKEITVLTGVR